MEYNGGAVVAMVGKNCVAIACDKRLGVQAMTISTEFKKTFQATPKTYIGLPGLATDVQTLYVVGDLFFRVCCFLEYTVWRSIGLTNRQP